MSQACEHARHVPLTVKVGDRVRLVGGRRGWKVEAVNSKEMHLKTEVAGSIFTRVVLLTAPEWEKYS